MDRTHHSGEEVVTFFLVLVLGLSWHTHEG